MGIYFTKNVQNNYIKIRIIKIIWKKESKKQQTTDQPNKQIARKILLWNI